MNLLFDLRASQPSGSAKRHGGGKYAEVIFKRMVERKVSFSCYYNSDYYISPEIMSIIKTSGIPLYDIKNDSLDSIVLNNNIDRIYSAIPNGLDSFDKCPVFCTIHDLRPLELPGDWFYYKYTKQFSLRGIKEDIKFLIRILFEKKYKEKIKSLYRKSFFDRDNTCIITVSEHSHHEILTYFPEEFGKDIKVFYSPNTSSLDECKRMEGKKKYFLSVSGNIWLKNVLRSIIAFDKLLSSGYLSDFKYIVTGANSTDFRYKLKNPDHFEFMGYVEDEELESLYANAFCFVYPSLSEGFGYPPLEAMRYKVPVISSPVSSMANILDSGALYFNPFSIEEIMNRMMMITNKQFYEEYSERGYQRYLKVVERQVEDLDRLIDYILG